MKISVIIPAYNEEKAIRSCLEQFEEVFLKGASFEVIVIDQSAGNETKKIVDAIPQVKRIKSVGSSRATTMNHGAREAVGEVLLFLHVDCILPKGWYEELIALDMHKTPWGGFSRVHAPSLLVTRIADWRGKWLAKYLGYMLGDNALFVSRTLFHEVGGYRSEPLFEDVHLCEQLRRKARWIYLSSAVVCSSRKFIKSGPWRAFFLMLGMQVLYQLGVGPRRLVQGYKMLKN